MEHDERINVRLPAVMLEQIDAFATAVHESAGVRVSRNEAVRVLLGRAIGAAPELKTTKRRKGA